MGSPLSKSKRIILQTEKLETASTLSVTYANLPAKRRCVHTFRPRLARPPSARSETRGVFAQRDKDTEATRTIPSRGIAKFLTEWRQPIRGAKEYYVPAKTSHSK